MPGTTDGEHLHSPCIAVTPAKAGVHSNMSWIPSSAGMTRRRDHDAPRTVDGKPTQMTLATMQHSTPKLRRKVDIGNHMLASPGGPCKMTKSGWGSGNGRSSRAALSRREKDLKS